MRYRLKSNFKYVWPDLLLSVLGSVISVVCLIFALQELTTVRIGRFLTILIFYLFMLALGIFGVVDFLLNWQWVIVAGERISVRCVLFEIRSIPISKIKRCWVCKARMNYIRGWTLYRDCIVIDTAKTRKKHTIPDGYSSRKHRYIIFPDTLENRLALRGIPVEARRELG